MSAHTTTTKEGREDSTDAESVHADLADAMAPLSEQERARLRAAHEDFARAAQHFDQPPEFYLVDLLQWRDYVAKEEAEHRKRLQTLPPPPPAAGEDAQPSESPVIAEARAELTAFVADATELAVLTEQLVALFEAVQRVRTSAHVAALIRYTVRTPYFQSTLLHNARYQRVRDFARWLLQCVKNAAYQAIETEQALALPDEPESEPADAPATDAQEKEEEAEGGGVEVNSRQ